LYNIYIESINGELNMSLFVSLTPMAAALYLVFVSFRINAYTAWATLVYNVLPLTLALGSALVSLFLLGVI
jgi:hypothetical protein